MNTGTRQNILLTMCALLSSGIFSARSQDTSLGEFESHGDVGSLKLAGSASYDPASQEYTLTGAGTNMWFTTDQFHFLWRKMKGDFILRARIEFIGQGAIAHRKVGWMVRPRPGDGRALRGLRGARGRPDLIAVPPRGGKQYRTNRSDHQQRERVAVRAQGKHLHFFGGALPGSRLPARN